MNTTRNITQQQMARFFGIKQPYISDIKRGIKNITLKMAVTMSQYKPEKNPLEWQKVDYKTFESACVEILMNPQCENTNPNNQMECRNEP